MKNIKSTLKDMKDGKRLFYYGLFFYDVDTKDISEVKGITVEVVASNRDEAEQIAREALGKDVRRFCTVTALTEVSIKALISLKDEATELVKIS